MKFSIAVVIQKIGVGECRRTEILFFEQIDLVKQKNVTQSMSHRGTSSDNALISSNTRVIDIVEKYIYFWNNNRILAKLEYLSPVDYRLTRLN